jgi:hypothetical protein
VEVTAGFQSDDPVKAPAVLAKPRSLSSLPCRIVSRPAAVTDALFRGGPLGAGKSDITVLRVPRISPQAIRFCELFFAMVSKEFRASERSGKNVVW